MLLAIKHIIVISHAERVICYSDVELTSYENECTGVDGVGKAQVGDGEDSLSLTLDRPANVTSGNDDDERNGSNDEK